MIDQLIVVDEARRLKGCVFPRFSRPVEVGSFSLDSSRTFCPDERQLRRFAPPAPFPPGGLDLGEGFDHFTPRDEEVTAKEGLQKLLQWIGGGSSDGSADDTRKRKRLSDDEADAPTDHSNAPSQDRLAGVHVVSWRGLLTKLMITPYNLRDDWEFDAAMRGTTLFFTGG